MAKLMITGLVPYHLAVIAAAAFSRTHPHWVAAAHPLAAGNLGLDGSMGRVRPPPSGWPG